MSDVTKPAKAKVRRNPLRGLPPAYDHLVRLWIVRILVFFGGLGALVDGDRITGFGDYATVMRQAELQPIPAAGYFIALLKAELSIKPGGRRRKVGF